ncbi:hypothetical protein [Sphingomonas sp.]|uniref:hypothetical protein n=1 Tax=Sphingomonas sp. TaxID=28214 RepID=UPI003CC59EAE
MRDERTYKVEAQERLEAILPLDAASEATALQALQVRRAFSKTNVLDSTEFARAHEMLGGPNGQDLSEQRPVSRVTNSRLGWRACRLH